MITDFYFLL